VIHGLAAIVLLAAMNRGRLAGLARARPAPRRASTISAMGCHGLSIESLLKRGAMVASSGAGGLHLTIDNGPGHRHHGTTPALRLWGACGEAAVLPIPLNRQSPPIK